MLLRQSTRLLFGLLLFLPFLVHAQRYVVEERTYTVEEGLSHNAVLHVNQDARGVVWVATRLGLNRFDGQTLRSYTRETSGLKFNTIDHIWPGPDGMLWLLAGLNGRRYLGDYREMNYDLFDPVADRPVDTSYLSPELRGYLDRCDAYTPMADGTLAFYSNEGFLLHYRGRADYSVAQLPPLGKHVVRMFSLGSTGIYLTTTTRTQAGREDVHLFDLTGRPLPDQRVAALADTLEFTAPFPTYDGRRWRINLAGRDDGPRAGQAGFYLLLGQPEEIKTERLTERFPTLPPDAVLEYLDENRGEYWISAEDKQWLYPTDGAPPEAYPGLRLEHSTFRDRSGNLFTYDGQSGFRLYLLRPNFFRATGARGGSLRSITRDGRGHLWLGMDASTFYPNVRLDSNVHLVYNYGVATGPDGGVWTGAPAHRDRNKLLARQPLRYYPAGGGSPTAHPPVPISPVNADLWTVWVHPGRPEVWAADLVGKIIVYDTLAQTQRIVPWAGEPDYPPINYVYQFVVAPDGRFWMASSSGLYELNDDGSVRGRYHAGGAGQYNLPAGAVHHLTTDATGHYWLSTGDAGLLRWHPDRPEVFQQYTQADGLPSLVVHAAYPDERGYLWLSTENGIVQFDPGTAIVTVYGPDQGTTDLEYNRTSHYRHPDGTIYFGGMNGVTAFHPPSIHAARRGRPGYDYVVPLDVLRTDPRNGQVENFAGTLQQTRIVALPPDAPSARLRLLHPDLGPVPYALFSQVVGWQDEPRRLDDATVDLAALPYGNHELALWAVDAEGNELERRTFTVAVARPFYLQYWFIALVLLTVAGLTFLGVRAENRRLRALVRERTAIIEGDRAKIEEQASELRQLDELKSRFFTNLSHELRTPLTLLLAPIRRLLRQPDLDDVTFASVRRAYYNGEHLRGLVNDILDLAKLEDGQLEVHREPTQTGSFLRRIVGLHHSLAAQREIELRADLPPSEVSLDVDRGKIETILRNLLANALRFTPRGGSVCLKSVYEDGELVITVDDTGPGIDPADRERIFDRFYQSSSAAVTGGTGIGLALCRELALLMQGTLHARPRPGGGTVFALAVPAAASATVSAAPLTDEPPARRPATTGADAAPVARPTVLVAEDNPDLREYLTEILRDEYHVVTADDGREALLILEEGQVAPAVILTDLMMPNLDGYGLLRALKATDRWRLTPTIVLSARTGVGDRLNALRTGIDDYILKPFDESELRQRIANVLVNARNRAEETTAAAPPEAPPAEEVAGTADDPLVAEAANIVRRNLSNDEFGNAELATLLFVSTRTLGRRVRAATGLTTNKFILEIRLMVARELLEQRPRPTVTAVAARVGFQKASYFSSRFRARFGVSPADYGTD